MIRNHPEADVLLGVGVGKGEHPVVALDRAGTRLYAKALPNDEAKMRAVLDQRAVHGTILFVADRVAP